MTDLFRPQPESTECDLDKDGKHPTSGCDLPIPVDHYVVGSAAVADLSRTETPTDRSNLHIHTTDLIVNRPPPRDPGGGRDAPWW